jgi:dienelactone hydrolase
MSNWDTKDLFSDVQYRAVDADGPIQSILFENEPYLGRPTQVFAYLGIPQAADRPVPGMVCVHGGGGTAFRQWVELWVLRGYAAIAMDLSGRDGIGSRLANGGPEQDHAAKFSTTAAWKDMWTYHAVGAVIRANSLLCGVSSVDSARIGITGISWGGYLTCIVAGVDTRFACAIPVYGCGFLQHNSADDWMKIFADMTFAQRQAWHDKCDPSVYLRNVSMPMLFVSGTNDLAYPLNILEMSWALPVGDVTRCVRVEMAHGHEPGWAPLEIRIFADQHLANGSPLPTIGACDRTARLVRSEFTSRRPIQNGYLLYTRCRNKWQNRKWHTAPATPTNGAVEAALPEDVSACILAIEDDRGAYVSSPYLEVVVSIGSGE